MEAQWSKGLRYKSLEPEQPAKKKITKKPKKFNEEKVHQMLESIIHSFMANKDGVSDNEQVNINSVQNSVQRLENNVIAKFVEIENEFSKFRRELIEIQKITSDRSDSIEKQFQAAILDLRNDREKDKVKTLKTLQKLHAQHTKDLETSNAQINNINKRSTESIHTVTSELQVITKDLSQMRNNMDTM
jgi:hypothetical protein